MKQYIVFDCYQTLIYKKNLEKIAQDFSADILKKRIPLSHIRRAYHAIYDRHKFGHPRFKNLKERESFYVRYNKELFNIMGISISSSQAVYLNNILKKTVWAIYPDVIPVLKYLKKKQIPIGLIANWTEGLDKILDDINLKSYFNFIHSSNDLNIKKPNPEIFTKSLKDIFKNFDTIYYVGNDYELDIVPAKKASLIPILIDRDNRYSPSIDCMRIKKMTSLLKKLK